MTPADFIEFGALGIVAYVLIYFTVWLTKKFNGSVTANTEAIRKNTEVVQQSAAHDEKVIQTLDEIKEAIVSANEETLRRLWTLVRRENAKYEKGNEE